MTRPAKRPPQPAGTNRKNANRHAQKVQQAKRWSRVDRKIAEVACR
jgi:hypothetical protein